MRYALPILLAAAIAPLAASPQTRSQGAGQPSGVPDGSTVTVTGCLARGTAPKTFVLEKVAWQSTNVPSASQAAHHQAAPAAKSPQPAAGGPETLRLAGAAATLKLDALVGHTISATGMLTGHDPVVTPGIVLPDAPARPEPQQPRSAADKKAGDTDRTLNLRSVTDVSPACK
jgi:hypothetical protein